MALSGRYLSPVALGPWVEGLPLLVRHFWSVHALRLFWGFLSPLTYTPHQTFCTELPASVLYEHSTGPGPHLYRPL